MLIAPFLGVFAGWLIVMPGSVITLALRIDELESNSSSYSFALAAGWLSLMLGLEISGRASDHLHLRTGTRTPMLWFGILGTIVTGISASNANTALTLTIAWCLMQVPASAIIATSLAIAAETVSDAKQGLSSGLVGGAPVLALLLSTVAAQVLELSATSSFLLSAIAGALLVLPLALKKSHSINAIDQHEEVPVEVEPLPIHNRFWMRFLLAGFLLSFATSSANGYLVAYTTDVLHLDHDSSATTVATLVLIATLLSLISGLLSGRFARTKTHAVTTYITASIIVGLGISSMALIPVTHFAYVGAALFGIGFGAANGLELSLFIHSKSGAKYTAQQLGTFTGATTAPFVLVPVVATFIVDGSKNGVIHLWLAGSACALAAAVLMLRNLSTSEM